MIYINLFLYTFSNFIIGLIWPMCLSKRINKASNVLYAIVYYAIFLLPSYVKFFSDPYSLLFEIVYFASIIGIVAFVVIAFKDPIWKKVLFFVFMMIAMVAGESIASTLLSFSGVEISVDFSTVEAAWLMLSVIATDVVIMLLFVFLWNRFIKKRNDLPGKAGFVLTIPISHLLLISAMASLRSDGTTQLDLFSFSILIFGISLEALIIFLLLIRIRSEREKKEKEIDELRKLIKSDEDYYKSLEEEINLISKARHDRNNKIAVLSGLIVSNDREGAIAFLNGCHE